MTNGYTVKINRREGIIEIQGDDKEWVDRKLEELARVYAEAPGRDAAGDQNESGTCESDVHAEKPKRRKRTGTGKASRATRNDTLARALTSEKKTALSKYVEARKGAWNKDGLSGQSAIIATFLNDELEISAIEGDDLYTVYSVMGWPVPGSPRTALENARSRKGYFMGWSKGKIALAHAGENYGRHESLDKKT